ncbi:hypothetical protein TNCV_4171041 [Trichonephila clavipes]|nr:hypothetical protein TNCV_4171041 [Trichonephila clavipes]
MTAIGDESLNSGHQSSEAELVSPFPNFHTERREDFESRLVVRATRYGTRTPTQHKARRTAVVTDSFGTPSITLSFEHYAGDSTILSGSIPVLRKKTMWVVRASYLCSPSANVTRRRAARPLFCVPPCRKGTINLKPPCLLRDSNTIPTALQSLTTIADGW